MTQKRLMLWFCTVSVILVFFGVMYCIAGLKILPVDRSVLLDWESAIYGAIMIGWGTTLFFTGRLAFRRNDKELMKILLYGIVAWLFVEALFSAYLGVYFNVGVDIGVCALFIIPLLKAMKAANGKGNQFEK
jgi:hypothetical protein